MNDPSNNHVEPMSVEQMVHVSLCDARRNIRRQYLKCENHMQQSPVTTVLSAVAVGCLLQRLPVRAILVTQVRVLTALAPPALFLYGAVKLYDCWQKRSLAKQNDPSNP